jgi:fructokinase
MEPLVFVGIGEAVHAHQLAGQLGIGCGMIVSCVNSDRRGKGIIDLLFRLGMSSRYIGKDSAHPTGLVSVFMKNEEPGYQIEPGAAWDYITARPMLKDLASQCHAVCFGSLAQRSQVSRDTIRSFLQNAPKAIRLYDVNLRRNTLTDEAGYSPEIVAYSCHAATIIKTNQSELFTILDLLGIGCPADRTLNGIQRRMELLLTHFPAQSIVVTRGAAGTIVLSRNGEFDLSTPVTTAEVPHPVGAGDACSAGILFGNALGWDIPTTMELANRMGADVAAHPSATPPLSDSTLNFAHARLLESSR